MVLSNALDWLTVDACVLFEVLEPGVDRPAELETIVCPLSFVKVVATLLDTLLDASEDADVASPVSAVSELVTEG